MLIIFKKAAKFRPVPLPGKRKSVPAPPIPSMEQVQEPVAIPLDEPGEPIGTEPVAVPVDEPQAIIHPEPEIQPEVKPPAPSPAPAQPSYEWIGGREERTQFPEEEEYFEGEDPEEKAVQSEVTSELDMLGLAYAQATGHIQKLMDSGIPNEQLQDRPDALKASHAAEELYGRILDAKVEYLDPQGKEEKSLSDYIKDNHDWYVSRAKASGLPPKVIEEIPDAETLIYAIVNGFAESVYRNPGGKNSLTAYAIASWKRLIAPANPFYRFMRYIRNPKSISNEVRDYAAREGWSDDKMVLEQYKQDAWGDPDTPYSPEAIKQKIDSSIDWWNKMYRKLHEAGLITSPPFVIENKTTDAHLIPSMAKDFELAIKKDPDKAERLGLVSRMFTPVKKYRENGEYGLSPKMFAPSRLPEPGAVPTYKVKEIEWWNEMSRKIAKIIGVQPWWLLSYNPSPEDIKGMKDAFDDFVNQHPQEAVDIGLVEPRFVTKKPWSFRDKGKYALSEEMLKPGKRQVTEEKVREARENAAGTVSMTRGDPGGEEYKMQVSEEDIAERPGAGPAKRRIERVFNPMSSFKRVFNPDKPREYEGMEDGVLSAVWGQKAADEYGLIRRMENEVRSSLPNPVSDDEMRQIMKEHPKSRHVPSLIDLYFSRKAEAIRIMSEAADRWEAIRPAFKPTTPPDVITRETERRQAALSILADKITREGSPEREIARTIASMPFELGGAGGAVKPSEVANKDLGMANAESNRRTMADLREKLRGALSKPDDLPGDVESRFNKLVRDVAGRMIGALANDRTFAGVEKELRERGFELRKGSWKAALMMALRSIRLSISGMLMEKRS